MPKRILVRLASEMSGDNSLTVLENHGYGDVSGQPEHRDTKCGWWQQATVSGTSQKAGTHGKEVWRVVTILCTRTQEL